MINHKKNLLNLILSIFCILMLAGTASAGMAEEYYYNANVSLTSGKITEAVRFYKLAIDKKNNFFEAYLGLSIAYRELGDYQNAYDSVIKALKIRPDYYQAYYNLGLVLEKQNKYKQAINAYEKFLKEVPGAVRFSDAKQRILKLKNCIKKEKLI